MLVLALRHAALLVNLFYKSSLLYRSGVLMCRCAFTKNGVTITRMCMYMYVQYAYVLVSPLLMHCQILVRLTVVDEQRGVCLHKEERH